MNGQPLPEFALTADDYGWIGKFPGGPHLLFRHEIGLEIQTRSVPDEPQLLPDVSPNQVALVHTITPALAGILQRMERELVDYNQPFDPEFQRFIRHPHVWLSNKHDDGISWTFVVERTDNPDFGYHAEFKSTEFIELWAGD